MTIAAYKAGKPDEAKDQLLEAVVLVVIVSLIGFWEWRSALLMALSTAWSCWARSRQGRAVVCQRTAKDRLARALKAIHQQCRVMRHWPVREQRHRLCQMLRGHFAYFGIRGNAKRLSSLRRLAERSWRYWLSRRSRTSSLSWEAFRRVLHSLPLPQP
jgi:uncharacterized protein with NAD-binding domain and iron-sulfur cluster